MVALTAENRNRILKLLGLQPVGEVWGVGRILTEKLNALGINTALQLAQANTAFILSLIHIFWNSEVIFAEINAMGYTGGRSMLRYYIQPKRKMRPSKRTVRFETCLLYTSRCV